VNLSVLHYERAEPAEAIACAERALKTNPNLPGAHFGLARPCCCKANSSAVGGVRVALPARRGAQPDAQERDPAMDGRPLPGA